jgi:hypothetical protein
MVYAFIRVKNRVPSTRDQVVGFLLAGPLFFFIDRQLRKREYKLSRFEYYGLLFVSATVLVIIMGAIVTTFFKLPV